MAVLATSRRPIREVVGGRAFPSSPMLPSLVIMDISDQFSTRCTSPKRRVKTSWLRKEETPLATWSRSNFLIRRKVGIGFFVLWPSIGVNWESSGAAWNRNRRRRRRRNPVMDFLEDALFFFHARQQSVCSFSPVSTYSQCLPLPPISVCFRASHTSTEASPIDPASIHNSALWNIHRRWIICCSHCSCRLCF